MYKLGSTANASGYSRGIQTHTFNSADYQIFVYWNSVKKLTFKMRTLPDGNWQTFTTSIITQVQDAHGYAAFGVDNDGYLHFAGGMHSDQLEYYRSNTPISTWDGSLTQITNMVNDSFENKVSYPRFFNSADGALWFMFRDGISGHGDQLLYKYNTTAESWSAAPGLTNGKLVAAKADGRNIYTNTDFIQIPNTNRMALAYYWRDIGDPATANNASYLEYDYTQGKLFDSNGTEITAPQRFATKEVVDGTGINSGFIGAISLVLDSSASPLVTYVKKDSNDYEQIYLAYKSGSNWSIVQVSDNQNNLDFFSTGVQYFSLPKAVVDSDGDVHIFVRGLTTNGLGLFEYVSSNLASWTKYEITEVSSHLTQYSSVVLDLEYFNKNGTVPFVLIPLDGSGIRYYEHTLN